MRLCCPGHTFLNGLFFWIEIINIWRVWVVGMSFQKRIYIKTTAYYAMRMLYTHLEWLCQYPKNIKSKFMQEWFDGFISCMQLNNQQFGDRIEDGLCWKPNVDHKCPIDLPLFCSFLFFHVLLCIQWACIGNCKIIS